MSLESRLSALISSIGADIKALNTAIGVIGNPTSFIRSQVDMYDDFAGEVQGVYQQAVSGTGAASSVTSNPDASTMGTALLTTGTTATGRCALRAIGTCFRLDQGVAYFSTRIRLPNLSNATNRYVIRVGFGDTDTADHVDGAYFEYDDAASALWRVKTASNSVRTTTPTAITVAANTWYRLEVEVNATGTEAKFYIDGTLVATHTANIPVGSGRDVGAGAFLIKSVGTTARTVMLDWMAIRFKLTTPR